MQQDNHVQGQLSPKSIVSLRMEFLDNFKNKIQGKQMIPDIISRPLLEDIIPFSEILNEKRLQHPIAQNLYYNTQLYKNYKTPNKQLQYHTSRSNYLKLNDPDIKYKKSKNKQKRQCSCSCYGCSRKNSTKIKKPITPQLKEQQYILNTNKTNESNQAIKQYSIVNSKSKCVYTQPLLSKIHKQKQCCNTNQTDNPKITKPNLYDPKSLDYKLKKQIHRQNKKQQILISQQHHSTTKDQQAKVVQRANMQKIEEGEQKKINVEQISQIEKEKTLKSKLHQRSFSNQNKTSNQVEQNKSNIRYVEQKKLQIKANKGVKDNYNKFFDLLKNKKQQKNNIKKNKNKIVTKLEDQEIENKVKYQIDQTFQIEQNSK